MSHFAGGALLSGIITGTVADRYWPEHRVLIGFTVNAAAILVGEGIEMSQGESFSSSLIDVVSHMVGGLIGSTITDRYILNPIVERDSAGNQKIGMAMYMRF